MVHDSKLRKGPANRRIKETPLSFTPRLHRPLTLPLQPQAEDGRRHLVRKSQPEPQTSSQEQSHFFQLPFELREMIYHDLLVVPGIHIRLDETDAGAVIGEACRWGAKSKSNSKSDDRCVLSFENLSESERQAMRDGPRAYNVLGLLCACRRMYDSTLA
jgi:hypothetical protein